jgi:hypothetical protein
MMRSPRLGPVALALALLTALWLWKSTTAEPQAFETSRLAMAAAAPSGAGGEPPTPGSSTRATGLDRAGEDDPEAALGALERQEGQRQHWQERLSEFQEHSGNLQQFLELWQMQCRDNCLSRLQDLLADYPDTAFAAQVLAIAAAFPTYLDAQSRLRQSTEEPPRERYARMDALREETFGTAGRDLLFGQEKAWAAQQFAYEDLLIEAPSLSTPERLDAFDRLQAATDEAVPSLQQSQTERYRKALALALVGIQDPNEAAQVRATVQSRYLDPESTARVLAREAREADQQSQVMRYWEAVGAMEDEMAASRSSRPAAEWEAERQQRLESIRQDIFAAPN